MVHKFDDQKSQKKIEKLHKKEEEELAQILSSRYGLPYADLTTVSIDTDGLRLIPEERARRGKLAIFDKVGKKLKVGILSPNRQETKAELHSLENRSYILETYMVSTASLERAWARYKDLSFATEAKAGSLDVSNEEISNFISKVRKTEDVIKMIEDTMHMKKAFKVSRIVEIVIAGAIATGASDIHVEPEEGDVGLRFRLDGVLTEITRFDTETYKLLLSRIKLLSGMKLNIKDTSQDGRFSVKIDEAEIEIRSSVLPGAYNESIVLRLLNPESIQVPLDSLGFEQNLLDIFLKEVEKPDGMILNTGPTGSGKTTTLYAFLRKKKTPQVKVITIEDPVEYHLPGIVQTQVDVKKGYDFAQGLKSSLRQDPDVIMVGEIRDIETAETAVHAALTGHLVFSTLHTNNAAGAFTRLIDLGINPKILTSAINLAIAQRLVRRLCPHCKKKVALLGRERELAEKLYGKIQNPPIPFANEVYEAVGCTECNNLGYKGRIAIVEAVLSDAKVEKVLQENPSEHEIANAARDQGIMNMAEDGLIKILKGVTTFKEVERVVDLETGKGYGEETEEMTQELLRSDFEDIEI